MSHNHSASLSTFPITFDATRLFYRAFIIPGVTGWMNASTPQTISLAPGQYSYQVQSGIYADLSFAVTSEGVVDYDPSCDRFLSGRGTPTLQLNGFEVTLDASPLSGAAHGGGVLLTAASSDWVQRKTIRLLPEAEYLVQQGSGVVCNISFALKRDGTFSYPPELDISAGGPLQGQGTASLTFRGHTIRVDATAVSKLLLVYQIWGQPASLDGKDEVAVLPASNFFLQLDRGVTNLGFTVGITGTVTLDPGMEDLLEVDLDPAGGPPTVRVLDHVAFQSPIYGPTVIKGAFLPKWRALAEQRTADGFTVQQRIGIPVEDVNETSVGDRTMVVQRFERGLLVNVKGRNTPAIVYGAILSRYHSLSEVQGLLGAPIADEEPAPNGGRRSVFEGGVIHWSPDSGAYDTHGAIFDRWQELGGPAGIMGYPISDELPVTRNGDQVGAVSRFQSLPRDGQDPTVGAIYWSPATGAHEMYGPILMAWQTRFGGPNGLLGFPTGSPTHTPDNIGRVQTFEKGLVVWRPEAGAVPIVGGIVLNLFSFAVDDDFNVQIDITSRFGATPGPSNHGRIPADGQFNSGTETFPPRELLSFPNVTPDLVVTVNQMEAISERTFGEDDRKGNVAPITYDINNIWGLKEADHSHHNGSFIAVLAMQHMAEPQLGLRPFRQDKWWPFANFDTAALSWVQYEQTFRDVAEVDKHIRIFPPRFHPLEIAVYEMVYKSLAEGGNCFGMVTEAMYALEKRSLFEEPIFSSGSYREDGMPLVTKDQPPTPENAEVANAINVKMGYQIGSDMIGWFLGKWTAGALHDPVRAFRESRDAFARGDWPLLTLSDKNKFSQDGHAVMPYAWEPATEEQINAQPLSAQTWHIYVANPNAPAAGSSPLPDTDDQCKITIDPFRQTWQMQVRSSDGFWTGSNEEGGRLLTIPYSLFSSRPNSPADMLATLIDAITVGALIVIGGDSTLQITDSLERTIFTRTADGNLRVNRDPATRIPGLALLPIHERAENQREVYVWRPDAASAGTALQHVLSGLRDYTWSLLSPSLSASVQASGMTAATFDAPVPADRFSIEKLGTGEQAVTHTIAPDRGNRIIQMSVAGWPGSDRSKAKWFEISGLNASPGHTVRAQVLNAGTSLSIHNDGPLTTFDLAVHSGLDGEPVALRQQIQMPAGKAWRFETADWSGRTPNSPIYILEADRIGGTVTRQFSI